MKIIIRVFSLLGLFLAAFLCSPSLAQDAGASNGSECFSKFERQPPNDGKKEFEAVTDLCKAAFKGDSGWEGRFQEKVDWCTNKKFGSAAQRQQLDPDGSAVASCIEREAYSIAKAKQGGSRNTASAGPAGR
jgi:hypothetical protein